MEIIIGSTSDVKPYSGHAQFVSHPAWPGVSGSASEE